MDEFAPCAVLCEAPYGRRGVVINPLILDGLIHGGVARGIGNAFYERLAYDENGQLLNGTFMDYHLPTSLDVPRIETGFRRSTRWA